MYQLVHEHNEAHFKKHHGRPRASRESEVDAPRKSGQISRQGSSVAATADLSAQADGVKGSSGGSKVYGSGLNAKQPGLVPGDVESGAAAAGAVMTSGSESMSSAFSRRWTSTRSSLE